MAGKPDYPRIVLAALFRDGPATRTELAGRLDIRKSTVGQVVAGLIARGEVREPRDAARGARLSLEPARFVSVGVEHRVDCQRMVVLDAGRRVLLRRTAPLGGASGEERAAQIVREIGRTVAEAGCEPGRLIGLGFSDFIPHDIGSGLKMRSIWMPGWGEVDIRQRIEAELGLRTRTLRCTDAFGFAEQELGACGGQPTFLTVQLDQGIGLSVFIDGAYLRGTTDIFGELGHTVYREDGDICKCGNRGCLETIAGTDSIVRKVKDNLGSRTWFQGSGTGAAITLADIIVNAREGNKLARLSIHEAAKAIGNTLAVVVNVLGVTTIVLYGQLAGAGEMLRGQVLNSLHQHCIYPLNQDVQVILSGLDEYASAWGAAWMMQRRHFVGGVETAGSA